MEQEYKIKESEANALLRYLSTQPFSEVEQGINLLRNLPKIEKVEAEVAED